MGNGQSFVLRGIDFGPIIGSNVFDSLSQTWYGRIVKRFQRHAWDQVTHVTAPTTLHPFQHRDKPVVIKKMIKNCALIARSLSNKGIGGEIEGWEKLTKPFFVSFISVKLTSQERIEECEVFAEKLKQCLSKLQAPVALEIDTTIHHHLQLSDYEELVRESREMLTATSLLGIPVVLKLSIAVPVSVAARIADHPGCDALSVLSAIPWGGRADRINWMKLFGSSTSPLAQFGNGELYGAPCMPILMDWLTEAKI